MSHLNAEKLSIGKGAAKEGKVLSSGPSQPPDTETWLESHWCLGHNEERMWPEALGQLAPSEQDIND